MSDAEWMVTRSHLMGKVQSYLMVMPPAVDVVLSAMPLTVAKAVEMFNIAGAEKQIMEYARLKAMDTVVAMSDASKHSLKTVLLDHMQKQFAGDETATTGKLQQSLFDNFSTMNRDLRRIALTESNEALGQGFMASLPVGARVKRIEEYRGSCQFCKSINGMEFDVVDPSTPNKDGWKMMWTGKTNIGRSSSPYRKTDDGMVKRDASELWWPTPGTIHPHCRGMLVHLTASAYEVNTEFTAWFNDMVSKKL